jgi:hypothetical protein
LAFLFFFPKVEAPEDSEVLQDFEVPEDLDGKKVLRVLDFMGDLEVLYLPAH